MCGLSKGWINYSFLRLFATLQVAFHKANFTWRFELVESPLPLSIVFFPSKSQEHGLIDSVWCQETTVLLKFKFSRWFIINSFYNERQNLLSNGIKNVQTLNEYERSNGKSELKAKEIMLTSIVMKPNSPSLRIKFGGLGWIL